MPIIDNRTLYDAADSATGWVDATGAGTAFTTDTEVAIEGSPRTSLSTSYISTTLELGILHDNGTAADRSNTVWWLWFNFFAPGVLANFASGGVTVRFCGATITDWFEFNVAGTDTYTGGWVQFVIDIQRTPDNTGGTPPATSAIRYVGIVVAPLSIMPKMADNYFADAIWFVDAATPAILVEESNGGTDWSWNDVVTTAEAGSWGTAKRGAGGSVVLNGGVRFGAPTGTEHGFSDTNQVILWEDQSVPAGFYFLEVIGGSGVQSFSAGVKTGSGDDATGAQGWTIAAEATGDRWDFICDDSNIDICNLYGCTFLHGGDFQLDNSNTSVISNLFVDCTSARIDNAADFLRNKIIDANTVDGVTFITVDDMTDIVFCEFEFSDGHAIELTSPIVATQTSKGNLFTGYGADESTDAALLNKTSGDVTIGITNSGDTPSVRNESDATTTFENFVTLTVLGITEGAAGKIISNETVGTLTIGDVILETLADSTGKIQTTTFNYEAAFGAGVDVIVRARQQGLPNAVIAEDGGVFTDETVFANTSSINDMTLFPSGATTNDAYYFAHAEQYPALKIDISQAGVGTWTLLWEFWGGAAWINLATSHNLVDGTNGFQNAGENKVTWDIPSGWDTTTINSQGPFYFIRARISSFTSSTTFPLGRKVNLDVDKYIAFTADREITSTGLTVVAAWVLDTISTF